ncbi:MAG: hypothetical protein UZ15_CFX003002333 [Chloroflexi bacterium OLB15]|nr:MAG: hypothetical protein UZ15_CFX003002333 [Chloroflexi bacterium OLB15]
MKGRDAALLLLGGVIGIAIALLAFSNNDLRSGLFGTALGTVARPSYVLVDMTEGEDWLESTYPDSVDELSAAFEQIAQLTTTDDFATTIRDTQDEINLLVDRSYTALTGQLPAVPLLATPAPGADTDTAFELPDALLTSLSDGNVSSCLGLDENPYNLDGYALYFYIEVPETQLAVLPEEWERLDEPMDDNLFWQRLACQALTGDQGERSR